MRRTDKLTLLECLGMALNWIDAVPNDTPLPAMPGFDRDAVNAVIEAHRRASQVAPAPSDHAISKKWAERMLPLDEGVTPSAGASVPVGSGMYGEYTPITVGSGTTVKTPAPSDGLRETLDRLRIDEDTPANNDPGFNAGLDAARAEVEAHDLAEQGRHAISALWQRCETLTAQRNALRERVEAAERAEAAARNNSMEAAQKLMGLSRWSPKGLPKNRGGVCMGVAKKGDWINRKEALIALGALRLAPVEVEE